MVRLHIFKLKALGQNFVFFCQHIIVWIAKKIVAKMQTIINLWLYLFYVHLELLYDAVYFDNWE